jgi:hypothetical protein
VHNLPSAAQLFHQSRKGLRQSLAENPGVDLGSESYAGIYLHIYMCVCIYTHIYVDVCVWLCVCVCVCV